jgi:Zn-dependent hydrolases, including glyoxylases
VRTVITISLCLLLSLTASAQQQFHVSPKLDIVALKPNVLQHITYIQYQGDMVPCNGLIYINGGEAVVMDTPLDDTVSLELLNWLHKQYPTVKVKAVIIEHFHNDCLGGLNAFHKAGIPSYASNATIKLAVKNKYPAPQNGFDKEQVLRIGNADVISRYFGPAHTSDNIVTYIPAEKTLFGGCMIKEQGADKGYLGDANTRKWSKTVAAIRSYYKDAVLVIPGHGDPGNTSLLDYTIKLFKH